MSDTWTIHYYHKDGGVLTAATTVKLSDSAAGYGVKLKASPYTEVVADGTAMTNVSTGYYTYTMTFGAATAADTVVYSTEYSVSVEVVYLGRTKYITYDYTTRSDPSADTRGTTAWACDEVEILTGVTTAGNALKHVQAGADRVIAGQHPEDPTAIHTWSWLPQYREITLAASDDDTCVGDFTGTSLALETTAAFFAGTSADVGRYLEIEDIGLYRITAAGSTTTATCTAATGQYATDFSTAVACHFAPVVDLPSDFGGLAGDILHCFSDTYSNYALKNVSADEMMRLWRGDNQADDGVLCFAIVPKLFSQAAAQAYQLLWYPRQSYTRIMRYRCHVEGATLTDSSSVYLPGGARYYDLFLQAGMAHAETYQMRVFGGPHEQLFRTKLAEAIALDMALFQNVEAISMADAPEEISRLG